MQSYTERAIPKPQRPPPPPPPSQSQLLTEQTILSPQFEASSSSSPAETSIESINDKEKHHPSLLSEFKRLFDTFNYESIREAILDRHMIECPFTTVLWRIFLHCLPRDSNEWNEMLNTSRINYEKLVNQYKIDPYKMNDDNNDDTKNVNHPLSHDENSLWAQYFADEELKGIIIIDVRRTYPDITFFRDPRMIDLQLRILFNHSRHHHKTIPYRQGMHEILGIIVYAICSESLKINEYQESNELMKKLYDSQYLEHDAYGIFEKIMEHLRQFYALTKNNSNMRKSKSVNDTKKLIPFQRLNHMEISINDSATRMNSIFERLRTYDRLLHDKLQEFNIEPTVYGIRWLRLLFGREIPFESIPNLWTVIFCFDEHFGFVDYFFIALLIQLGQIIGKQEELEHTSYLQSLMKQNVITNIEPVIRKALNLTGRQIQLLPDEPIISSIRKTEGSELYSIENDREDSTRAKELQRIPIASTPKRKLIRPHIVDARKSVSPPQMNNQMEPIRHSSSNNTSSSEMIKSSESYNFLDSEMNPRVEKTVRERFEDNIRLQKCCAQYMNKFIERLQKQVCDLGIPNEDELHIQLSGLKQIATVLDGTLTFDGASLQTLVDYKHKPESSIEENNNDTG
ncbi:unnamed protein product [Adineta steineri]|uniref:Rab-GAP TBC domain-containing protein n=1 Tax=Adineta steineri TaxID=433720 RepID=A0A818SR99_9BILA|nr:unnamed protein product [Adineta steineri]